MEVKKEKSELEIELKDSKVFRRKRSVEEENNDNKNKERTTTFILCIFNFNVV